MGQCLSVHVIDPLVGINVALFRKEKGISLSEAQSLSRANNQSPVKSNSTSKASEASLPHKRGRVPNKLKLLLSGTYSHVDVGTGDSPGVTLVPQSPTKSERTHPATPASTMCISPPPETPKGASTLQVSPLSSMITPLSSIRNSVVSPLSMGTAASDYQSHDNSPYQMSSPSFLLDGLDRIMIPEEVDPDAPSDEEDSYQRIIEGSLDPNAISAWEMEPGPILTSRRPIDTSNNSKKKRHNHRSPSPSRPMSAVKARHERRVARPTSIVRHHPHISPPAHSPVTNPPPEPPGAVDRQTLAEFNKLQIQVQLQEKSNKQSKRLQKLEDRFIDVQSYRKLIKDFEEIQETVSVHSQQSGGGATRLHRTDSFDLKETSSWYFDFDLADRNADFSDLEDDEQSLTSQFSQQSQLSLLSESSMDSQRKYYAAKKHTANTKKRIEKLEQLLREMNARKKQNSSATAASEPATTGSEELVSDYGPRERRGSFASNASFTSDYGPAVRRGSNASKTSVKSDYGQVSAFGAFPTQVTMREDYGPSKRRGSATSQISVLSDNGSLYRQALPVGLDDDDDDELSHYIPSASLGSSTQNKKAPRAFDASNAVVETDDIEATPKRSGHASAGKAYAMSPPDEKIAGTPTKQHQFQGSLLTLTSNDPPQDLSASPVFNTPTKKPSSLVHPDSPTTSMEEKKCDEEKKGGAHVPRWRSFLNQSPFLRDNSKTDKPSSPPSGSKLKRPSQDANIFSMSTHEFLQIAEDQFEDLKVVSISKFETEDEGTTLQGRRLDFSDEGSDDANLSKEEGAVLSTSEDGDADRDGSTPT